MRYRSYKRWGFKDPKPEDSYWLMDTHPMYMEQARKIDPYVWSYFARVMNRSRSGIRRVSKEIAVSIVVCLLPNS